MNYIIYMINFPNGKSYIGLTGVGIKKRMQEHLKKARNGSNYAIHRAIRKYKNRYELFVLKEGLSQEKAKEKEMVFISLYETHGNKGYNLTQGGEGVKITKDFEYREALSKSKGFPCFYVIKDGVILGEYYNRTVVCEKYNILYAKLQQCLLGKVSQTRGYSFEFKQNPNTFVPKSRAHRSMLGRKHSEESKMRISVALKGKKRSAE